MSYQREFEKKINIGVVGVGSHCYRNILPALHYLPVRLKAVCDIDEDLAQATAAEYGCSYYTSTSDMYNSEKLDAVILCVSAKLHPQMACEAFDLGLHVWMEKPPAMRAYELDQMIERRKNLISVVGFKKAFMPSAVKAKEVVESKDYGNPISILATYPMEIPTDGADVLKRGGFTKWLGNGCHPVSFMLYIGGYVEAVTTYRNQTEGGRGGIVVMEFKNGILGNFHFASGPHPCESYSVYGKSWNLTIDNSLNVTLRRGIPFSYRTTTNYVPEGFDHGTIVWEPQNCLATLENKALFTQGMYFELNHFCDCILKDEPAKVGTLEFTKEVMKVYEAALLSDGNRVYIKDIK